MNLYNNSKNKQKNLNNYNANIQIKQKIYKSNKNKINNKQIINSIQ